MPELPEVETVRRRLHPELIGRTVCGLDVLDATVGRQSEDELRRRLVGSRVVGTARRGKWLIVDLGEVLMVVHLRMTGRLLWQAGEEEAGRRPRFTIDLDDGRRLHFFDVRRFGGLWAVPAADAAAFFAGLGPEPLGDEFTVARLLALMAGRTAPLKSFLTDQRRLAGVGNIYADEALFRARLHPLRPAGSVGPREAQRLHAAVVETLELGIAHEGSSVESFVDPAGSRGRFQEILNVYQRTGEPCRVCGTPIRRIVVGGRGTHFCPRCQPRRGMKLRTPAAQVPVRAAGRRRPTAVEPPPAGAALYVVATGLTRREVLPAGALGEVTLERGWHAYVGSARRGRAARVARHFRAAKPLRWHADYLFSRHPATLAWLVDERSSPPDAAAECGLAEDLLGCEPRARRAAPGFGSSDCGCGGHLIWFPTRGLLERSVACAVRRGPWVLAGRLP